MADTLTMEEQREQRLMHSDYILSFDDWFDDDGSTQFLFSCCLNICESEEQQIEHMMDVVEYVCEQNNLPKNKLYKISTACNWTLFEELTGKAWNITKGTNGKFYFGERDDLSKLNKVIMARWGFGVDVKFVEEDWEHFAHVRKLAGQLNG